MYRVWLRQPPNLLRNALTRRAQGTTRSFHPTKTSPKAESKVYRQHAARQHEQEGFLIKIPYWALVRVQVRWSDVKTLLWAPWIGVSCFFGWHWFTTYVLYIHECAGPSMLPTLEVRGDMVAVSKLHRRGRWIKVGDVVSFVHPVRPDYRAMKRVVGMPGDYVLRNTPMDYQDYDSDNEIHPGKKEMIQVPQGHCWVIGDNLPWSRDSRFYGPVPLALIRGKCIARHSKGKWFWQWDTIKGLQKFDPSKG